MLRENSDIPSALEWATLYASLGLRIIPCVGKIPAISDWKRRASNTPAFLEKWCGFDRYNPAILCDKVAVIDTDSQEAAAWWERNMPKTSWQVQTRRGRHFYYLTGTHELRNAVGVEGKWDVRAGGQGYVLGAGSLVAGVTYQLLGEVTLHLPTFDPSWLGTRKEVSVQPIAEDDVLRRISRARAYLSRVDPAVSGQGGHNKVFYAASRLKQLFDLPREAAWPVLCEYNERCQPPFSEKELTHKLDSVYRKD